MRRLSASSSQGSVRFYASQAEQSRTPSASKYDVIIVGGGHNGLVSAAYLAQQKKKVLVLERRHVLGGSLRFRFTCLFL